jgi:hypothetical protein
MKITITMDLDDGYADPDHPMGITEAGYDELTNVLMLFGSDIDVKRADDS